MRVIAWCVLAIGCGRVSFVPLAGDATPADTQADAPDPLVMSCTGLPSTCGPAGTSPCCASPVVTGGMFFRGYDVGTDNAFPNMTNPATVSDFRLDTYEVTVGRFRQFVTAGMGTQASPPIAGAGARQLNGMANQGGWNPAWNADLEADTAALIAGLKCSALREAWTDAPGANESLPINCVTWFEAMAFCIWDGGFLPTQAEWNYAAVGGAEHRAFPWSNPPDDLTIDCSYANHLDGATHCVDPPNGRGNRVGSEPAGNGRWGHADLAGNVREWVLDAFAAYGNPCMDCADLTNTTARAYYGGGFVDDASQLRGASRTMGTAGVRISDRGVRCARLP